MDFNKFDEIESKRATVAMAHIEKAIEADMMAQKRKFVKTKFSRWVDGAYGLSNKKSMTYGAAIGRKIIAGKPLDKTNALVKGSDFAKVVYYALDKEGNRPWVNLRAVLKELKFEDLSRIHQTSYPKNLSETVREGVQQLDFTTASVASQLRDLATKIEPIEAHRDALLTEVNTKNLTILEQSNKLTERNQLIQEVNNAIHRLKSGIAKEQDEIEKEKMVDMLDRLLKKFDDLK